MNRTATATLLLVVVWSVPAGGGEGRAQTATPADQYKALVREFNKAAHGLYQATTDAERTAAAALGHRLTPRVLELVEKHPKDPIALDALAQVITQELWLENNTAHPGFGADSPAVKALAILSRDHLRSDKLAHACWRTSYGFRKECETFLRAVLQENPHEPVRALACLRLAQLLNARLQRLDLLKERPEMAKRYEAIFGKDYLDSLQRQDRIEAIAEVEALLERAGKEFANAKLLPYGDTVGTQAKTELHALRHLAVGKHALDIDGTDQDGNRFKLSDYRGKVVLLYFWSEY